MLPTFEQLQKSSPTPRFSAALRIGPYLHGEQLQAVDPAESEFIPTKLIVRYVSDMPHVPVTVTAYANRTPTASCVHVAGTWRRVWISQYHGGSCTWVELTEQERTEFGCNRAYIRL